MFNLINIDLNEAGKQLVKEIFYHPKRMLEPIYEKGIAKAQTYAQLENAKTTIEIAEQVQIAEHRMLERELGHSQNMINVVQFTSKNYNGKNKLADLNDAWVSRFIEFAENTYEDELQKLFGKILAGELEKPGTYSTRTLSVLNSIGAREADMIREIANLTLQNGSSTFLLFPISFEREPGPDRNTLRELDSLGVVQALRNDIVYETFEFLDGDQGIYACEVNKNKFFIVPKEDASTHENKLTNTEVGEYYLTMLGKELVSLVEDPDHSAAVEWLQSDDNYFNWTVRS